MHVFVTGASGFIGSAVVAELLAAGHEVTGLTRSAESAAAIRAAGAVPHRGDLADPAGLRAAAETADAVAHLAFHHDFTDYARAGELDRQAITAFGEALAGSNRPLLVTSGLAALGTGDLITESDAATPGMPRQSEAAALGYAERGVRVVAIRLSPTVHGKGDHGFVPRLIEIARDTGVAAYPGEGANRWSAVHRLDAARLFRLALEQPEGAPAGSILHGVAEEGIASRVIAEAIGSGLGLPVRQAEPEHFGWLGAFFAIDMAASSERTRKALGWNPIEVGLLDDLVQGRYFD